MSWENERRKFFMLAKEVGMVEELAAFANVFGRFPEAKITLSDGRSAEYKIPSSVTLPKILIKDK